MNAEQRLKRLAEACRQGDYKTVAKYLKKRLFTQPININCKTGTLRDSYSPKTPLEHAVECKKKEIAELLISKGADVNDALWIAIFRSHDMIEFLISKGADMNARNDTGDTPFTAAFKSEIKRNSIWITDLFLKNGAYVEAINSDRNTPLIELSMCGRRDGSFLNESYLLETAKFLLSKGADVNAKNPKEATPLILAAGDGQKSRLAKLFILNGADVNAQDNDGNTPLILCALQSSDLIQTY